MNEYTVFYLVLGIFSGAVFSFCFSTADKKWSRTTTSTIIFPITFGVLVAANEYFSLSGKAIVGPSTCYIVSFAVTFAVVFLGICYLIKIQKAEKVRLRVLDIVLGYSKALENYYLNRQEEIHKGLNLDEINDQLKKLNDEKKKSTYASQKLQEKEERINELLKSDKCLSIQLPIEAQYPVSKSFIKSLPVHTRNVSDFCLTLDQHTNTHISLYNSGVDKKTVWTSYFVTLCNTINTTLFDTHRPNVRSHVRILSGDSYIKVISVRGDSELKQDLTPIPKDLGMIIAAYRNHSSLVRSLNPKHHHRAANDSTWDDYITFAIEGHEENGYPLLSMGISISNSEKYQDLLYFINYLRIEHVINESVDKMHRACDLNSYIAEWRNENG